jgi:site-specific recombinase XerD
MIDPNYACPDATLEQLLVLCREIRPMPQSTAAGIIAAIHSYGKHLRRPPAASDLSTERIKAWLASLRRRLSAVTIRNYKEWMSVFWRALFRAQLVERGPPERYIKPKVLKKERYPKPPHWSQAEPVGESQRLSPKMRLIDYHAAAYTPAKTAEGVGQRLLDQAKIAIRWLSAFLKREATLSDLNDAHLSRLMDFVISHGRLLSTARGIVERLLSLWRFAVWNGHLTPGSTSPKVTILAKTRSPKPRANPATLSEREARATVPEIDEQKKAKRKQQAAAEFVLPIPATAETTIHDLLFKHYSPSRDLGKRTVETFVNAVVRFSRFLGRPAKISDLTAPTINAWLADLLDSVSRQTAHGYRNMILILWRFAYETEVVQEFPRRVRPIKVPKRHIEGYDTTQMQALLAVAGRLAGTYSKTRIERRLFWGAYLLVAWYSGLRVSDMLGITKDRITRQPDGSGQITIIMQKTGESIYRLLPADAMDVVGRCIASGRPRTLVFPLWGCRRDFFRNFVAIAVAANLPGTLRWIRRGSASEIERTVPGGGRLHLGHKSIGLFESAYKVDRIVNEKVHLPPRIGFDVEGKAGI